MRVKYLAQEHMTMSPARAPTRTARSGDERTNHEATAPPLQVWPLFFFSKPKISSQELIKQLQYENKALQSKIIAVEQTELQEVGAREVGATL